MLTPDACPVAECRGWLLQHGRHAARTPTPLRPLLLQCIDENDSLAATHDQSEKFDPRTEQASTAPPATCSCLAAGQGWCDVTGHGCWLPHLALPDGGTTGHPPTTLAACWRGLMLCCAVCAVLCCAGVQVPAGHLRRRRVLRPRRQRCCQRRRSLCCHLRRVQHRRGAPAAADTLLRH